MHESTMHPFNSFVTLTYNDDNLPPDGSLHYADFQLFMKRLRSAFGGGIRFYMCGEYGENTFRPHFHACLFNCFFPDRQYLSLLDSGSKIYRSPALEALWPHGFSSIGDVTFESAAYVARYICKKITGPSADAHYSRVDFSTGEIYHVTPEFSRMSLKPGIGATWFAKYHADVFDRDYVIVRGAKSKPPRYYDNLLKARPGFMSDYIEFLRTERAHDRAEDNTPQRLADRELVTKARLSTKYRSYL